MSVHTPGPWIIHRARHTFSIQSATKPHAGLVAHVYAKGEPYGEDGVQGYDRPEEAEANARLIAAAPDLLRVCKNMITDDWRAYLAAQAEAKKLISQVEERV